VESISEDSFFSFLSKRTGILDGVCVTGGEPTLSPDLLDFCRRIKAMGYALKLDTNGTRPDLLRQMIEEGLVDYVAMDIKNDRDHYAQTCGLPAFPKGVEESMELLLGGSLLYEFRTTIVRPLHDPERIGALAALILGDGLLLGMILGGKIDTLFGVLFVAVLSALCGAKVKR
jgi:pyruvate formate lyase activating enzyme